MKNKDILNYNFEHLLLFIIYIASFLESHYSDFNHDDMLDFVYKDERKEV